MKLVKMNLCCGKRSTVAARTLEFKMIKERMQVQRLKPDTFFLFYQYSSALKRQKNLAKCGSWETTMLHRVLGSLTGWGTQHRNAGPTKGSSVEHHKISKPSHHNLKCRWTRNRPGLTKTEGQFRTGLILIESNHSMLNQTMFV